MDLYLHAAGVREATNKNWQIKIRDKVTLAKQAVNELLQMLIEKKNK